MTYNGNFHTKKFNKIKDVFKIYYKLKHDMEICVK